MSITRQALMNMFYRQNPEFAGDGAVLDAPDDEVKGIRMMPLSEDQMQEGYLYLAAGKHPFCDPAFRETMWIISVSDEADGAGGDCCRIPTAAEDISYVFNAFCTAFDSLSKWEQNVDLALAKGEPLQQILNLSSDMMETPILIYDPSMKLIGHINERIENNPWFHDIIDRGYIIQDIFSNLSSHHIFEDLEQEGEALINAEDQKSGTYTKIKLMKSPTEILGYVFSIYYEFEQIGAHSGLFEILCDKIQLSLEKMSGSLSLKQDYLYEYFITDVLNGTLTELDDISVRFRYIDIPEGRHYVLMNLCFREDIRIPLGYLSSTMKSVIRESYFFHYEEQPYVMVHLQEEDEDQEREDKIRMMRSILKQFDCVAIVSENFKEITQLPYERSQTDKTNWLYKNGLMEPVYDNVIRVEDCRGELMMLMCLDTAPAEAWIHPAIKKIIQDDEDRNMKYIDFLNAYREANCEVGRTAEKLFMHRSNVTYHLGKVRDRYGLDANDSEQCFDMVWSLRLLEFEEKMRENG
ncbi:MAG: helix-turn-helix domain-containing protein [Lachnospiraceae bacterium]|nr:helix-turn-helix domain-containing protein [Lachnospiraceae bacterium]